MKTNIRPNTKIAAFSMIEMIGVLAVIAILAALLIPKVFDAINSAKINNTASGLNTVKTAVVTHFGKFGALDNSNGISFAAFETPLVVTLAKPLTNYDTYVLVAERIMDKQFESKICSDYRIELAKADSKVPDGTGGSYWLSGQGTTAVNETAPASLIVQAHLFNVAIRDAMELSRAIDGPTASLMDPTKDDFAGRVQYAKPASGTGVTDVFVYMESK